MYPGGADPLAVGVLVEQRYRGQSQPAGLCTALAGRGHVVRLIDPRECPRVGDDGWLDELDVLVPRGRSLDLLALVSSAERRGVPVINGRRAIDAVRDKLEMAVALAAEGLPLPATFIGTPRELARQVPASRYPLILKPALGDNAAGLRVVRDAEELSALAWPEPVALAQHLIPSDGHDLKLYGIGEEIWAVRKPSPLAPANGARPAVPVPLTDELADLGRRCGALFGLELFGVDCVETPGGAVVIEVNDYPNYTGVPAAGAHLAALVERRARAGDQFIAAVS